jgi:hypothetical protein
MRYISLILILSAGLLTYQANGWANIPTIPERHPGWGEGKNRLMIKFEVFADLLCDGCAMLHAEFDRFLNMTYLGSPVRDQIGVNYAFLALPYHHASWIPHRLLPYIIDECVSSKGAVCKYKAYIDYTFGIRDSFLDATNITFDDLTTWWINTCNQ